MEYTSTRNAACRVDASRAIIQGLSEDGGLFVPVGFPRADLGALAGLDYPALAAEILGLYLTDYSPSFLRAQAREMYGSTFGGKAGWVSEVEPGLYSLELWHGPTCAFKDYALQLMPRLLAQAKRSLGRTETTLVLVATSGDTGKAALAGCRDLAGVRVAVFYPTGGTSEIQRLQMATQEGQNLAVYAVEGNFDDAQAGVKRAFTDPALAAALAGRGVRLSSANSINWGRLAPQIAYYFFAWARLAEKGRLAPGQRVDFCVPTGNFGDILAGWYAKQMGLPVGRLICASNKNRVLTDFFETGRYDARRTFYKTESPSMDILVSSNLERLLWHLSGSDEAVRGWMDALGKNGGYTVPGPMRKALQADFAAGSADSSEAAAELRRRYEQNHYLCDPHTAVAFKAAREQKGSAPMVVLSTASPFKFPRAVLAALGQPVPEDDFAAMAALEEYTGARAPASLAGLKEKPVRFTETILPGAIGGAALRSC